MDPADITIVKGEPTAEEIAALVTVLLAAVGQRPVRAAPSGITPWRASGLRSRSWQGPTSWAPPTRPSGPTPRMGRSA
jgi:Acyl-CoA carboxylase epsilon subunit